MHWLGLTGAGRTGVRLAAGTEPRAQAWLGARALVSLRLPVSLPSLCLGSRGGVRGALSHTRAFSAGSRRRGLGHGAERAADGAAGH